MSVAPVILVHVEASGEDCHWYKIPVARVAPVSVNVKDVPDVPKVGDDEAVPAVGEPEQGGPEFTVIVVVAAGLHPEPEV